jgi:uncharacterized membrane protein YphA (DoxX/SURF4 family)
LQRLFTAFPDGWPGIGLLLLRTVVGVAVAGQGTVRLANLSSSAIGLWAIDVVAIVSGVSLLIGFLTPGTGALAGLCVMFLWVPTFAANRYLDGVGAVLIISNAAALVLLGPGAFSLDARLFGRREILIPHESCPQKS